MNSREVNQTERQPNLENLSPDEKRALLANLLAQRAQRPLIWPLTSGQRRLWFFEQMEPGTSVFNLPFTLRLTGPLSETALDSALTALSARHETLRTAIAMVDEQPAQIITPNPIRPLVIRDLRGMAEGERNGEVDRLAAAAADAPFDLSKPPLWRAELLKTGDHEHILLFTIHHLIADGWSIGVFLRDLTIGYEAAINGAPPAWQPLALQYGDVAQRQQEPEYESRMRQQLAYWQGQFAGRLPVLHLPIDAPRPAVQTYRAGRVSTTLAAPVTAAIKGTARRCEATLFMALLGALKVVLWRLSGETDVIVGAPVAGRARAEEEDLIGLFINTLGLRTVLDPAMSFNELVNQVKSAARAAYAHADVPFDQVVQVLQIQRDQSRTPIFQVLFNLLGFRAVSSRLGGAVMEVDWDLERSAKFDLTVYARESGTSIALELVYNADLFEAARMEAFGAQLAHVVEQVGAHPEIRISEIDLVGRTRSVLPDPSAQLPSSQQHGSVLARLRHWSAMTPDTIAVSDVHERWSYAELDRRSDAVAHALARNGVGPGSIVAIYAHRGASLLAATLGVWKSGAAFFVLDPAQPALRLAACAEMLRPTAWIEMEAAGTLPQPLVTQSKAARLRLRLPASGRALDLHLPAEPLPGALPDPAAGDRAYVAFTSGSTGRPRAILGTHGPITHFLDWYERTFKPGQADRTSVLSGLGHDPLFRDILAPIWSGGTAVMPDPDRILEPGCLSRWMQAEGITLSHLTPPMAEVLLQDPPSSGLGRLRAAFFGGEPLRAELVRRFRRVAPGASFVNFYGATETPQAMGWNVIEPLPVNAPLAEREIVPLGRGIDDVQLLVLNDAQQLAGIGELGEIVIRTPYLAEGYLNDDALTAAKFVANPFTGSAEDRVYRTGDLGRYLPDGRVEFAGRRDLQVKIRGYRVELEAIEATIREHPAVDVAVAALDIHEQNEARIVGYVKWRDQPVAFAELEALLRVRLPDYMIPSAFGSIDSLPLTPNGKIDRKRLPRLDLKPQGGPEWTPPAGPTEEALAEIFKHVLQVERVGRHDSFFALGGHSLAVTRLVARVNREFGVELSIRVPFETPTLAGLAQSIETARIEAISPQEAIPTRVSRTGELPLSFAQERMWFLYQLDRANPSYSIAVTVWLRGGLDIEALRCAWRSATNRHEVLRTVFPSMDGRPRAWIRDEGPELVHRSLDAIPDGDRESEVLRLVEEAARVPFDLETELPCRATLWSLGANAHIFQIMVHHIVADQWSLGVLTRELADTYNALRAGRRPDLPEPPLQYVDFTAWQRNWLQGGTLERQFAYWRERLADLEPLEMPTDYPRPSMVTGRGAHVTVPLPASLGDLLRICEREGVTLFMLLLAAFKVLLYRYTGKTDVAVGAPIANRTRTFTEPLVGMFVNTLVLRTSLDGNPSFRELLARVRDTALGGYAHQDLPFEKLVAELHPTRDLSHAPLVQVLFNLQNAPLRPSALEGLTAELIPLERGTAQFDLSVAIEPENRRTLTAEYSTDLFDEATIRRLLGHYLRLLEGAAADPAASIGSLPMLAEDEHRQVVRAWNATSREYDRNAAVEELLARRSRLTPEKIAVRCGPETLTYRELNARASTLAAALQRAGVRPEAPVAICLERSVHLPVAMLGILKAGGAYVPLDPAFPGDRLAYMLADSGARVLVTAGAVARDLDTAGLTTIDLDDDRLTGGAEIQTLPSFPGGERLAYVIYTSGSTGRPKGVQVVHRGLVNFLHSMAECPGLSASDVLLSVTTPSFDIFGLELYLPLFTGGTVVIATAEETTDGARLASLLDEHGVTVMQATPATWRLMMDAGWAGGSRLKVLCGGESMGRELADQLLARAAEVWNLYGPTETTIWSTVERVMPGSGAVSVGRPIWNTEVLVLDANLQPVPVGVPAEMFIGGDGLARGYFNRPELDAERFVPHPFAEPPARLYRTGDLGRFLPDGRIECLGRSDNQVKLRGFRIELGEIESVLGQHEAVAQAVASVYDDIAAGRRLVAYVAFRDGAEATPSELRRFARQHLPEYMVPSLFAVLDEIPLTPNGKVNRKALPAPVAHSRAPVERIAPRTDMERLVAAVWKDVLGIKDVGIHDNFFDVGGHSLLSIQAIVRLEKQVGVRLNPARLIMDNLEQISAACEGMVAAVAAKSDSGLAHMPQTPGAGA